MFVVSTGRKLHLWKSPEPLRAFTAQNNANDLPANSEDALDPILSMDMIEEVEMNADGDCLSLLGGSKLLGRTKTIVDLASATHLVVNDAFVLAQTSSGDLYSWQRAASSIASQAPGLITSAPSDQDKPSVVKIPLEPTLPSERVRRIACGRQHVVAMSSSGAVFVWGSNEYGQLGLGGDTPILDRQVGAPTKLELGIRDEGTNDDGGASTICEALDIACGSDHSLVLTTDGQVLAFGCHWHGQLGLGEDDGPATSMLVDGCCYLPTRVAIPSCGTEDDPVASASASDRVYLITAQGDSSAAVTARGDVFQWGKCVPSGIASVCGLVSRWRPERVVELNGASGTASAAASHQGHPRPALPNWHSIAIAHGVVALARHTKSRSSTTQSQ